MSGKENGLLNEILPFLKLFKFCGLFPVKGLKRNEKPYFKKGNISGIIYSVLCVTVQSVIEVIYCYRGISDGFSVNYANNKLQAYADFSGYVILVLQVVIGTVSFVIQVNNICELLHLFQKCEEIFNNFTVSNQKRGQPKKLFLRAFIGITLALSSSSGYDVLAGHYDSILSGILNTLHITSTIIYLLPNVLYFTVLNSVDNHFKELREEIRIESSRIKTGDSDKWNDIRIAYGLMCNITSKISECFGFYIFIFFTGLFCFLIQAIFFSIAITFATASIMSLISGILILFTGIGVTAIISDVTISKGKGVIMELLYVDLKDVNTDIKYQISLLLWMSEKLEISAASFFTVRTSILTSIASSVCTYVVILIQFNMPPEGFTEGANGTQTYVPK